MTRRKDGRETWQRLKEWDKGQAPSERLAAQVLVSERFENIDPSHPLGGKDGIKDIICTKNGKKYIVACYFPRGQMNFTDIKSKFQGDLAGIEKNKVEGIVFITNQELTLGERDKLNDLLKENLLCEIYHLERISTILNSPENFGIRLDFLDIEMTREEQVSYMARKDNQIIELANQLKKVAQYFDEKNENKQKLPTYVFAQTHSILDSISTGSNMHNCSKCHFGFYIMDKQYNPDYTLQLPYIPSELTYKTVQCPNCGNVDRVYRSF